MQIAAYVGDASTATRYDGLANRTSAMMSSTFWLNQVCFCIKNDGLLYSK